MLKVAISGLIFPLTMMRYFWNALEKRDDVQLFVVGPYYGNAIPWKGGIRLPQRYVKMPDLPLPEFTPIGVPSIMATARMDFKPDVWIQFDAGWHFGDRPNADVVVLVETDPHVLKGFYSLPKSYSDFTFCMQTPYMEEKEHYLPYAYDPDVHYPEEQNKEFDVALIGLQYDNRRHVIDRLRSHGVKCFFDTGPVFDEYRKIINQSKIGFNWTDKLDMNARTWELAAMNICAVENTVPDMTTFFVPEQHYLSFKNADEAEKKIVMALADEDMRCEIADAAYRKVTSGKNTYSDRIQQILETIRVL